MLIRLILPLLFLSACAGDSGTSADGDKDYSWDGGLFQLTSFAVDDSCLDGGFVPLLLPEGEGSTNDGAYPIDL